MEVLVGIHLRRRSVVVLGPFERYLWSDTMIISLWFLRSLGIPPRLSVLIWNENYLYNLAYFLLNLSPSWTIVWRIQLISCSCVVHFKFPSESRLHVMYTNSIVSTTPQWLQIQSIGIEVQVSTYGNDIQIFYYNLVVFLCSPLITNMCINRCETLLDGCRRGDRTQSTLKYALWHIFE